MWTKVGTVDIALGSKQRRSQGFWKGQRLRNNERGMEAPLEKVEIRFVTIHVLFTNSLNSNFFRWGRRRFGQEFVFQSPPSPPPPISLKLEFIKPLERSLLHKVAAQLGVVIN